MSQFQINQPILMIFIQKYYLNYNSITTWMAVIHLTGNHIDSNN